MLPVFTFCIYAGAVSVRPDWAGQDYSRKDFTRRQQWAETLALLHEEHVPAATMTMRAQREPSHRRARLSSGRRETLEPLTEDRRFE